MPVPELQNGFTARVYRALFQPRLPLGLTRDVCATVWGLTATAVLCFHRWWAIPVGLGAHGVLAFIGRNNPYWFRDWRRKFRHADTYESRPVLRIYPPRSVLEKIREWVAQWG